MNFIKDIGKRFRSMFGRYESAQPSPLRASVGGIPADADAELPAADRERMVNNAREAFANNGFVRDIVACNDIYSVGDGIVPQAATADADWNAAAEDYFARWSRAVSLSGNMTLAEATSLVSRRLDVDGEVYAVKTRDAAGLPRLFFVETHRVDESGDAERGWRQGIRFSALGTPEAYAFFSGSGERVELDAAHVIHAFVPETFSSIHGLPQIQHALNSIQDTKEILALVVARGKLQNSFALKSTSDRAAAAGSTAGLVDAPAVAGKRTDPDELKKIIPARVLNLAANEDVQSLVADAPGTEMLNALALLDRRSCGGVLPPDFFDPSRIGGASVRMVVSKAARHFERRQTQLIDRFLRPVWLFVIGDAIARGRLPARENWTDAEWACPKSITVDAGREAVQDRLDVLGGFCSWEDYFAARGKDWRKELPRIVAARAAIRDAEAKAGIAPDERVKLSA